MSIVGGYTLELYCENATPGDGRHYDFDAYLNPAEYVGEYGSVCRTQARRDGWKLKRDGRAFCPKCSKEREGEKGRSTR